MATGFEIMGSKGGTLNELRKRYFVENATDEQDVLDWVIAYSPSTLQGLGRSGFTFDENEEIEDAYEVEVRYGGNEPPAREIDSVEYSFNFTAASAQIYQSLSTISSTRAGGGTAPDFDGAINVVEDAGGQRVEGLQLPVPSETFSLTYRPANATITPAYQDLVESMVGLVNSTPFKGRPAGSLMLVRAQGGATNNAGWSISFGFGFIANRTSVPVGGITVPSKDGLDLLWAYYESDTDATAKSLIKKPLAAYVERVFYRTDFNALGI